MAKKAATGKTATGTKTDAIRKWLKTQATESVTFKTHKAELEKFLESEGHELKASDSVIFSTEAKSSGKMKPKNSGNTSTKKPATTGTTGSLISFAEKMQESKIDPATLTAAIEIVAQFSNAATLADKWNAIVEKCNGDTEQAQGILALL